MPVTLRRRVGRKSRLIKAPSAPEKLVARCLGSREFSAQTRLSHKAFSWSPAPQPITMHFALQPHGGVSRGRGGRWYSPFSPPRAVGPSSHRKALWEECAAFPPSALRPDVLSGSFEDGCSLRTRGHMASDRRGPGQERAAALSLVRPAPQQFQGRESPALNAWRAAASSSSRHVVDGTSGGPEVAPCQGSLARSWSDGLGGV